MKTDIPRCKRSYWSFKRLLWSGHIKLIKRFNLSKLGEGRSNTPNFLVLFGPRRNTIFALHTDCSCSWFFQCPQYFSQKVILSKLKQSTITFRLVLNFYLMDVSLKQFKITNIISNKGSNVKLVLVNLTNVLQTFTKTYKKAMWN